jgi:hypothetical protein
LRKKSRFFWTFSLVPVHDDYAVGLLLSDAKEFAMDRNGGQCLKQDIGLFFGGQAVAMMALAHSGELQSACGRMRCRSFAETSA